MPRVTYYSPSLRKEINLNDEGIYIQTAEDLRGYEYSYSLGYRSVSNVANEARKVTLDVIATDNANLDELRHAMDSDLYGNTPGLIKVGDYTTKVLCMGSDAKNIAPLLKEVSLDLVMLNPYWERPHEIRFVPTNQESVGLDYPYDLPIDMPISGAAKVLNIECAIPCDVRLTMYGIATSPTVSIGSNTYAVDKTVNDRERIVIDTRDKTITYCDSNGNELDAFASGIRGEGKGSGNYCFEQVKPGVNKIGWNGEFGFDLVWYERDTVIPWTLS